MRGHDTDAGERFRPRARVPPGEEDASFSDRGVFDELELFAKTPELRRGWDRVRTAAIRGAAAAVLIKGGLHTLTFVMYLLSRLRGKGRQRVMTLGDVLRDTVLHTCFLATLGSSYTAVDEGIALVFGKASTQRWRALVAGLVAGQSLRITGSNQRHYSLATYILLRGLTLLVRTGNKPSAPPALRALLRPTRMQNGDTLLMCVAASQILYSFIMAPSTLPATYVRFITRMGGKDPYVWAAVREHASRNSRGLSPGPLRSLAGTPLAHLNTGPGRLHRTPCEFFHPGQSCVGHAMSVMPQAYSSTLSVYVPFYLVSSVLVHRTALLARPKELLPKMAVAVLRSSAFLSAYIGAAFAGACSGFCVAGTNTGTVIAGSVWTGGLATLIEKKSRRMELAMYCAARALEAFIRCCWLWGWAGGPEAGAAAPRRGSGPRGPLPLRGGPLRGGAGAPSAAPSSSSGLRLDVLLFSLGCGAIMHCYSDARGEHRDVFRSKYLNVLDFIFGNEGVQRGSISHVPTNLQLVSTVGRRLRTMSHGLLSASASGDYYPLPLSSAHLQADGLRGLRADNASCVSTESASCTTPGHLHHGGHVYNRHTQHQQQQRQQSFSREGASPLSGRSCNLSQSAVGAAGGVQQRLGVELAEGNVAAAATPPPMPYSLGGSSSDLPLSPVHGLMGQSESGAAAGGEVVQLAAARLAGEGGRQEQAGAAAARKAAAAVRGQSAGGSSNSSGEWEDVWAATTSSSPNVAAAAAAAVAISRRSSAGAMPGGGTGGQGVLAAAPPSPGALGWAARLMAGALGGVSRVASSAPLVDAADEDSAPPLKPTGAAAAAGTRPPRRFAGGAVPPIASGGSMRRIMTAPTGLDSPQVLLLLSDPASERSGRGRSSYQQLQRLSGEADSADATSAAANRAGPPPPASLPSATATTHAWRGAALSSVPRSGGQVRGRTVPLPNADSRTPAFRSPPAPGGLTGAFFAAAQPAAPRRAAAEAPPRHSIMTALLVGRSVGSGLDRLADSFSLRSPRSGDDGDGAAAAAGGGSTLTTSRSLEGAALSPGSAVTFAPRGAFSHTSPGQDVAVWPRVSLDMVVKGTAVAAVSRSAPERRVGAFATLALEAQEEE